MAKTRLAQPVAIFRAAGTAPTGTLNTSFNKATYGGVQTDTAGAYSSGSYTIPRDVYYDFSASATPTGVPGSTADYASISIRKNNVDVASAFVRASEASGNGSSTVHC